MNRLPWLLDVAWSERLGWTILHSFWQIAAITALYAGASLCLRRSSAAARYVLGCMTLAAMVCLPLATFALLGNARPPSTARVVSAADRLPSGRADEPVIRIPTLFENESGDVPKVALPFSAVRVGPLLPWLSGAWLLGVVLFSVRPLLGLLTVRRLRCGGLSPPSAKLARLAGDLVVRLHIRQSVHFAGSALVQVPTVLGYLRPIVLLPASALTGLTAKQLELILAHELAHVRRHDYLVNVLQTGIETILFYHPGMWWVSAQVRKERENCCDDIAVGLCGSRATYVRALLAMEEQRTATSLALAASGGSLLERVRRLIAPTESEMGRQRASAWFAGLLPVGVVALLLLLGPSIAVSGAALDADPIDPPASAEDSVEPGTRQASADSQKAPAEVGPSELAITVTLEDSASEPLKFVLLDRYSQPLKTWEKVAPGDVRLDLPQLERDRHSLKVSASGYAVRRIALTVSGEGIRANVESLELPRRRYAVLRYAVNLQGQRTLTGPHVKEGRVAISYGSVPDLHGDWLILQAGTSPVFDFHRYGSNGFARPPAGASFQDIDLAPHPDQYTAKTVVVEKGMVLLNRIQGNGPRDRRYAKILVEDVTESPPKDIQVIDTFLPPTISKAPPAPKIRHSSSDRTSGEFTATIRLEDDARDPITLELRDSLRTTLKVWENQHPGEIRLRLPELEHDRYVLVARARGYSPASTPIAVSDAGLHPTEATIELHRLRYLILRYVMNTKGLRNLTGTDVKAGRVAVLFGRVSELRDWSVGQTDGHPKVVYHRRSPNAGFATAAVGASFDALEMAPPTEDYSPSEITFEKGMILFNRVVGHRREYARYAKLLVEDITETRPTNLKIIDARPR